MASLNPSLQLLRVLAGEGSFHIYRLLNNRRFFLFVKCLLTTLGCFKGKGSETDARSIVFVKGPNQFRYFQHARPQLAAELSDPQLYASTVLPTKTEALLLPRITGGAFVKQFSWLLLMLLTGKRRYLNLYLLAFASAMEKAVDEGFKLVETFVCFNDQPFDVAAILHALHKRQHCRTIVVQHGLILSHKFYFPAVAKEFWAWGELSRQHFRAWLKDAQFVVKGRYRNDVTNKSDDFIWPPEDRPVRILIAPSYFHEEVKAILKELDQTLSTKFKEEIHVAIKLHPATKFPWQLRRWYQRHVAWLKEEHEPMELLATKYDVLVTKNSTSAIDFLLRGKPVFFLDQDSKDLPSLKYAFLLSEIELVVIYHQNPYEEKNYLRIKFLKHAVNV